MTAFQNAFQGNAFQIGQVPTTHIKAILGLAKASVKTVEGLAVGSVKTIEGLD
jgi:hypothetical protein